MSPTSRWHKLFSAIIRWWRNEAFDEVYLFDARVLLTEYDVLYGQRTQPELNTQWGQRNKDQLAQYRAQAASITQQGPHKRAPGIESEVRVLAITVERLIAHLESQRNG
jgi:hypothetical protein